MMARGERRTNDGDGDDSKPHNLLPGPGGWNGPFSMLEQHHCVLVIPPVESEVVSGGRVLVL
jgi:hypothetical protein